MERLSFNVLMLREPTKIVAKVIADKDSELFKKADEVMRWRALGEFIALQMLNENRISVLVKVDGGVINWDERHWQTDSLEFLHVLQAPTLPQ